MSETDLSVRDHSGSEFNANTRIRIKNFIDKEILFSLQDNFKVFDTTIRQCLIYLNLYIVLTSAIYALCLKNYLNNNQLFVFSMEDAVDHIHKYGSSHTEVIVTGNCQFRISK